jgi:hypothetical protein
MRKEQRDTLTAMMGCMPEDTMTVEDIRAAITKLEEANVPPIPCSVCRRTYYLVAPLGWEAGDPIRFVCECGQDNTTTGEPCAGALVGNAVRYQGRGR